MKFETAQLKEILLTSNYVSDEDFAAAEAFAVSNKSDLLSYLYSNEILSEELFAQAVAEHYKVSYINLDANKPDKELILQIPADIAKKFRIILFKRDAKTVSIATDNLIQEGLREKLIELFPNTNITVAFTLSRDIDEILRDYRTSLNTRFAQILQDQKRVTPAIVEEIIRDALDFATSDIHFEPGEDIVTIRFRVDGVLQEAGRVEKDLYSNILNTIKVLSKLRIDDHFSAQDGSIRYKVDERRVDLRVSITPTLDGEKIVIRLLGEYIKSFNLRDLGLSSTDQKFMIDAAQKPFGMILATGPTGSGKTTTLYSILKLLNKPEVNITTIEDPVEYKVQGINQIQVNNQTNLTFAKGLRSIVRQDPDIILVGEIRDEETAEIAVNAALTGHLLLSTFHANDAATAVPRLLDMGIEPFLVASTLQTIVAQRLVRRICTNCKRSIEKSAEDFIKIPNLKKYFPDGKFTVYEGTGCNECHGSGFQGRIAIYEFINVTPELQELILTNPSSIKILELAKSQGSHTLFEDGLEKVKSGLTTLEEVLRIAPPK